MRRTSVMLGLVIPLLACGARAQDWSGFSFSKAERKIGGHRFTVGVDTVFRDGRPVLIARLLDQIGKGPGETKRTDSEHCPALAITLATLPSVEPFKITPPGDRDGPSVVVLDGDAYELHARGYWPIADRGGEISLSSNAGPLATWVDDALKALAPCWRNEPPPD